MKGSWLKHGSSKDLHAINTDQGETSDGGSITIPGSGRDENDVGSGVSEANGGGGADGEVTPPSDAKITNSMAELRPMAANRSNMSKLLSGHSANDGDDLRPGLGVRNMKLFSWSSGQNSRSDKQPNFVGGMLGPASALITMVEVVSRR